VTTHGLSGAACNPTTVPSPGDLSHGTHGASVSGSFRIEPCVCGVAIIAPLGGSGGEQVLAHNQSPAHQEYRLRVGIR
jgi:hypothetical protein